MTVESGDHTHVALAFAEERIEQIGLGAGRRRHHGLEGLSSRVRYFGQRAYRFPERHVAEADLALLLEERRGGRAFAAPLAQIGVYRHQARGLEVAEAGEAQVGQHDVLARATHRDQDRSGH